MGCDHGFSPSLIISVEVHTFLNMSNLAASMTQPYSPASERMKILSVERLCLATVAVQSMAWLLLQDDLASSSSDHAYLQDLSH